MSIHKALGKKKNNRHENPEAKHSNKRQTVQDQAIFSPITSMITVFLFSLMGEVISPCTCDHTVIAVTPASESRREGAEEQQPPAFLRLAEWVTRCRITVGNADPAICLHLKEDALLCFACDCRLTGSTLPSNSSTLPCISLF